MNRDEFLKEELKAQFEFLKIYSIFLIGLVTAVVGMILNETYIKNNIAIFIFIAGILVLVFVAGQFVVLSIQIRKVLKQLKK